MSEERVNRLRFDEKGKLIEESTYATEGELQGFRPEQLPLDIGSGERPIDTLPLFAKRDEDE